MDKDRAAEAASSNAHAEGRGIRRLSRPGVTCGFSDVVRVAGEDGAKPSYFCTVCKSTMPLFWAEQVKACGLKLPT